MAHNFQQVRTVITIFNRIVSIYKSVLCRFPGYSIFVIACTIITGIVPIVLLWVTKLLMDSAVAYLSSPLEMGLFKPVIYVLGLYLCWQHKPGWGGDLV